MLIICNGMSGIKRTCDPIAGCHKLHHNPQVSYGLRLLNKSYGLQKSGYPMLNKLLGMPGGGGGASGYDMYIKYIYTYNYFSEFRVPNPRKLPLNMSLPTRLN